MRNRHIPIINKNELNKWVAIGLRCRTPEGGVGHLGVVTSAVAVACFGNDVLNISVGRLLCAGCAL